jgi:hypothetical protein
MTNRKSSKTDKTSTFLSTMANTGHPFWKKVHSQGKRITINIIKGHPVMDYIFSIELGGFKSIPSRCFHNSFCIANRLKKMNIKYVEGFAISDGMVQSHAWISFDNTYFDPTYEHTFGKKSALKNWHKQTEYIAVAEYTVDEIRDLLGFTGFEPFEDEDPDTTLPLLPFLLKSPDPKSIFYSIKHGIPEFMALEFSERAACIGQK